MLTSLLDESMKLLQFWLGNNKSKILQYLNLDGLDKKLLIEQLVMDILFDKYLEESEMVTRNEYAKYMSDKLFGDKLNARAINENINRGIKYHYNRMKNPILRGQLVLLSINPNTYDQYYNTKLIDKGKIKIPKYVWDYFYYNFGMNIKDDVNDESRGTRLLTSVQYHRQLHKESRNIYYEEFKELLRKYDKLLDKILPVGYESSNKYYNKIMDYYYLETYKRVDYMLKLAMTVPEEVLFKKPDKKHYLLKYFIPQVLVPYSIMYERLFD